MFLAGHPSQGCFGLQSHCAPCYFFNQASFYPSDFSFMSPGLDNAVHKFAPQLPRGHGSLVVKESDHGWHATSSSLVPPNTRRVGERCTLNLSRAQTSSRWCGVVVRRGVPAQVSSSSLDHGSNFRGPSPKALV
ncbi:uncharacterized protein TNCV_707951 [Trichonephila clavipes]|nr:uncharacterized protein TNCV_707951 [Trichonephila clavipes]